MVVPLLFGLFWGAPLVAKELEDGTHNLVVDPGRDPTALAGAPM